ncbi:MAG: bifunctional glutamate N-acetyltransferase/amino-acid acetyltransferase ArgJ [Thiotrichaceae bacterium]|nr:bifunctional glutamate N-acetyltransferase/amino-acid acetyltransferase ArgJ [Thiotrichaceae bacterium]
MSEPVLAFHAVAGIRIGTTCAQIKQAVRDDLTLFEIAPNSSTAAVFTQNAFCAAPVTLSKQHLHNTAPRFLLINSGNANAGTGAQGLQDALSSCASVAAQASCTSEAVLPFSTGVIGVSLPVEKICKAIPIAFQNLSADNWDKAARAIMTTDTVPKLVSRQAEIGGHLVTVTGISKGAGMIRPDMATMLGFIATDASVPQSLLQECLHYAANRSFNRVTIDGDTSTNDSCVLVATGKGMLTVSRADERYLQLRDLITEVCIALAQAIVRDGEGATKFITVRVEQGANAQECLDVAYTIAHSPLVKTAFFASDANWGRILAAVGRAGLNNLDLDKIKIYLGEVCIVENGGRAPSYTEAQGQAVMSEKEITIRVLLARGDVIEDVWTCDFSYDYVKINAEYRT